MVEKRQGRVKLEEQVAHLAIEVSHAVVSGEEYREHLVNRVLRLFAADASAGVTTWNWTSGAAADQSTVLVGALPPSPETTLQVRQFANSHPGLAEMARVGTARPVRVSDHANLPKFWTTETYSFMHGPFDGRYPVGAVLLATPDVHIFLGMHRRSRDFTDAEMAMVSTLQRPIAAAMAFRVTLDETVRLLQDGGCKAHDAPSERRTPRPHLASAIALCVDYAPTRREGEVLALAAQGWTNIQIGRRLGITERTVRKHLTAVYDKAGIRGRAAAAAWWQRLNM